VKKQQWQQQQQQPAACHPSYSAYGRCCQSRQPSLLSLLLLPLLLLPHPCQLFMAVVAFMA
jgi:hypothetical protein